MTPVRLMTTVVRPTLDDLAPALLLPLASPEARVLLLAAALQESGLRTRVQEGGGTARSFWQLDTGGLRALTGTQAGSFLLLESIRHVTRVESLGPIPSSILLAALGDPAMDRLACAIARLLLWLDPHPLPATGDEAGAWQTYRRCWRPGRERPEAWHDSYRSALDAEDAASVPTA